MTAPKTLVSWGFAAKAETTYGTKNPCTVSDGVLLKQMPSPDMPHWVNEGNRGNTPAGAPRQAAANSGRWGSIKAVAEGIGSTGGVAYTAGLKPQLATALTGCGFTSTGSFTAGQEYYVFTPAAQPTTLTSLTVEAYLAGQMYRIYGSYGDLEIVANGPVIPDWNFDFTGIMDTMADNTIPAYTSYPNMSDVPLKADTINLTIGTFTGAVVKSLHWKLGRSVKNLRTNMNVGGHAGYTPGYRKTSLEVVIERCALATVSPWNTATTLNPYMLAEAKLPVILTFTVGATQYKRWTVFSGATVTAGVAVPAAQAMLVGVKDTAEGPTATWTLTFDYFASTYGAADECAILYN